MGGLRIAACAAGFNVGTFAGIIICPRVFLGPSSDLLNSLIGCTIGLYLSVKQCR